MPDTSYQGGDYTVGLFGIEYQNIPEVQIPITEWQAQYGINTQPQKNDIVYIEMLHKIFEVTSSTVVYTVAERPMYFKLSLQKYAPQASRRESEELKNSIDQLTVTQEDLFGETISQEVADAVAEVETAYNTTSTVDPMKDFDMTSVVIEPLNGPHGVTISNAYYDMMTASKPVTYRTPATFESDCDANHWLFSCWFCYSADTTKKEYAVRKLGYVSQDNKFWYFTISTPLKLKDGDQVTISKGTLINITGYITQMDCYESLVVKFKTSEVQQLNRKMENWHKTTQMKIRKSSVFKLFSSNNDTFSISADPDKMRVMLKFGEFSKEAALSLSDTFASWTYMMIDFNPSGASVYVKNTEKTMLSTELKANVKKPGDFSFEGLSIPCNGHHVSVRNIRLYENEFPMTKDIAERDSLTEVTQNASKLIVVDAPNVPQKGDFYSPAR